MYQQDLQIAEQAPRALSHDIALGCAAAGAVQVIVAQVARTVSHRSAPGLTAMLLASQPHEVARLRREANGTGRGLVEHLARRAMRWAAR